MGVLARDNVPRKRVMRVFHFETKPRAGITSGLSQSGRDAHATFACAQNTRSTRMPPLSLTDYPALSKSTCPNPLTGLSCATLELITLRKKDEHTPKETGQTGD